MKIFKYSLSLLAAFIFGVGLTILIFRPVYIDERTEHELTIKLLQVQDFALLNKKSEKFAYCYRYEKALENIDSIKSRINEIDYENSTVTLKMTIDWAKGEIGRLDNAKRNLKYECEKT